MSFFRPSSRERLMDDLSMWEEGRPPESRHQCEWLEKGFVTPDEPGIITLICMVPGCGKEWEIDTRPMREREVTLAP